MPLPRHVRAFLAGLCVAGSAVSLSAQPVEAYPDRTNSLTLNGTWQFAYQAGPASATEPANFAPIAVPGHWELQGFAEPKYGKNLAEGTGYYRLTFPVPSAWNGQRVMLRFDGVLAGFAVSVNGKAAGTWTSGYNPVTFDITDLLRPSGSNELAVTVNTRSHGWEFDTNDCWSLSGIFRDVTLFAVPPAHLKHYTARTTLGADGSATLTVTTLTALPDFAAKIAGRLLGPDGKPVADLAFANDKPNVAVATATVLRPQLWTAESPVRYTLELAFSSGQKITEKIGLREVKVVNGVLQLNGRPIKLRGVDHHDLWPDTGRATNESKMRRDLELIKGANCNFVRTSHYPPHPKLIELCDEMGLYVMDEVPFGFGEEHLADEAYRDELLRRAEATVRRDENRPSVILWSVGNENQNTPLTIAAGRRVKELDPSRPVCFPQIGSYFAKSHQELPDDIDVYAPHYPSLATVQEYAAKLTRPVIFTEYAHALGLATDQVQAQWAVMQASPRLAGGAIWMFQDQGILRAATAGQTPASSHELGLNVWPDATHYYDTHGNQGMDGIVYSDRTPQVDYWQVRKVYSPVQIATGELPCVEGANTFAIEVENRFDFRALAGCTLQWSLLSNGQVLQSGTQLLQAAARGRETVAIAATVPAEAAGAFNWLALRCVDDYGRSFYERRIRLRAASPFHPRASLAAQLSPGALTLGTSGDAVTVGHRDFRLIVTRATGVVTLRDAAGAVLATGLQPHAGRRLTEGEFVRAKKESPWTGALLSAAAPPEITATRTGADITLRVAGRYPRPEAPTEAFESELILTVKPNGTIEVAYDLAPVNGRGLLLEAGVALAGAAGATEFRWMGQGPYAGYPGKDALNEFGRFHLNRGDLDFQGNRRGVELAALVSPAGAGVLLLPENPADVAVENNASGVVLSHNAVIAGRGTKFVGPDTFPKAEATEHIAGRFTLLPLGKKWPAALLSWLGEPAGTQAFQPYFHSYDQ
jgi:beta-galactosidase